MADVAGEGKPSQDLQFNGDFDSASWSLDHRATFAGELASRIWDSLTISLRPSVLTLTSFDFNWVWQINKYIK